MSMIYDISESPTQIKLKKDLFSKLTNNNNQANQFNTFINNYNILHQQYTKISEKLDYKYQATKPNEMKIKAEDEPEVRVMKNVFKPHSYINEKEVDDSTMDLIKIIKKLEKENKMLYAENCQLKAQCDTTDKRIKELSEINLFKEKQLYQLKAQNNK